LALFLVAGCCFGTSATPPNLDAFAGPMDRRRREEGRGGQKTQYRLEDLILWWFLMLRRASAGGMLESLQSLLQ
jgi:hypothetical protein